VDVEVEWTGGDLQGTVGDHMVQCKVTRLASVIPGAAEETFTDEGGRLVASQCFHVPFTILDTNECTLPPGHPMKHRCHSSAACVNTDGSYECLCPAAATKQPPTPLPSKTVEDSFWETLSSQDRSPWELSFDKASMTSCPGQASTHGCCPARVHAKGPDAAECRAAFRCPVDPCRGKNTCATSATCVRKSSPTLDPNYECKCPDDLMGNGHKCRPGVDLKPEPKVMFDGKTPTEMTVKNNLYCDCTKPVVDACSGFPPCKGEGETKNCRFYFFSFICLPECIKLTRFSYPPYSFSRQTPNLCGGTGKPTDLRLQTGIRPTRKVRLRR